MDLIPQSFFKKGTKALKQAFASYSCKDPVTLEHSYTMGGLFAYLLRICMMDQVAMFRQIDSELNISSMSFNDIAMVGALHDVGKQFIDHEILYKPGKLTDQERAIVSHHPETGADFINDLMMSSYSSTDKKFIFADLVAQYHHNARIVRLTKLGPVMEIAQIADIIDATSQQSRTYHTDGVSIEKTLRILNEDAQSGKIDPTILAMVLKHLDSIKKMLEVRTMAQKDPLLYLELVGDLTQNELNLHPLYIALQK